MAVSMIDWELERRERFARENKENSWENVIFANITTLT
jgi:hypothetical protein